MQITTNYLNMEHDLGDIVRSFSQLSDSIVVNHTYLVDGNNLINIFTISEGFDGGFKIQVSGNTETVQKKYQYFSENISAYESDNVVKVRLQKREIKLTMYRALCEFTQSSHLWGSLMGIRPVKLFKSIFELEGKNGYEFFRDYSLVSKEKTDLVQSIYDLQKPFYPTGGKPLDLYIGIPFCQSRCYYCSFISADLRVTNQSLVEEYVDSLVLDIRNAKRMIIDHGYDLRTVYMGGGTPTALTAPQLSRVLKECEFDVNEFTVEAGRPDTIDKEKLDLISKVANRISVNPQTLKNETLQKIGRNHSADDFFRIYDMATKYNFDINCDLIAGLVDETADDFENSLGGIVALNPENITVHTLALKAGSKLRENTDRNINAEIGEMLNRSYSILGDSGYNPYYLYRQKYMAGNLENTGFCKTKPCVYNIDIMEENTSNIACGSYGISKHFYTENRKITRFAYPKDVRTYIDKLESNLSAREDLFK